MPIDKVTVTDRGLLFRQKMLYSCEKAVKEQWFLHAKRKSWSIPISYDPRSTNFIYLRGDDGLSFEKCWLLESQAIYKERCLEEIEDWLEYEKMLNEEAKSKDIQSTATFQTKIEHIKNEAIKKTDLYSSDNTSNSKKVKNIKLRRADEKEQRRHEESWELGQPLKSIDDSRILPFRQNRTEAEDDDNYIAPADYLGLLNKE
jgi:hypothetical protein